MIEMIKEQWTLMYCAWVLSGLVLALILLAIPKRALVWLSARAKWFTPDFITVGRLPFVYIGYVMLFSDYGNWLVYVGFLLIVFGQTLDRLDGKLADANDASGIPGLVGSTERGKWLDPLADKLSYLPLFIWVIVLGILPSWLVMIMIVIEFFGTIIRKPFNQMVPFKRLSTITRGDQATGVGKFKVYLQAITMIACIPYFMHWVESPLWIPQVLFGGATVMASLSVLSKIHINNDVDALTDLLTSLFSHR